MDTLPLPDQQGLVIEKIPISEKLENSKGRMYRSKANFRKFATERIKITQYSSDVLPIRQFLLDHHGVPFLWSYTGSQYYCLEVQINYLEEIGTRVTGTVSLTLQKNTNID